MKRWRTVFLVAAVLAVLLSLFGTPAAFTGLSSPLLAGFAMLFVITMVLGNSDRGR